MQTFLINYGMKHEETQVYTYNYSSEFDLSVIFYSNPLFDNQIDEAIKEANKTLGIIKRTFTFINKNVLIFIYKVLVRAPVNMVM